MRQKRMQFIMWPVLALLATSTKSTEQRNSFIFCEALFNKNQSPITAGLNGNRWDAALTGCYTLAEREKNEKT